MCTPSRAKRIILYCWMFTIVYCSPWIFLVHLEDTCVHGFGKVMYFSTPPPLIPYGSKLKKIICILADNMFAITQTLCVRYKKYVSLALKKNYLADSLGFNHSELSMGSTLRRLMPIIHNHFVLSIREKALVVHKTFPFFL